MTNITLKDIVKNAIFDSQDEIRNKLDRIDVELLATNITNDIKKNYSIRLK